MLGYLILLFTLVPLVELMILLHVSQYIGVVTTIMVVVFTGIAGAYLARTQGFFILINIQKDINQGLMPGDKIFDGVIVLCSGILLLTPGFITDFLGFCGLIPFTRTLLKRWLQRKAQGMIQKGEVITINNFKQL